MLSVQTFLQNLHDILLPLGMYIFTTILEINLPTVHNFQLFLYYAYENPIIPELFSLKLQSIIPKIMPAY